MPGHFALRHGAYAIQAAGNFQLARLFGLATIVADAASLAVTAHLPVSCRVRVRGMGQSGGGRLQVDEWSAMGLPQQHYVGRAGASGGLSSQSDYILTVTTLTRGAVSTPGNNSIWGAGQYPSLPPLYGYTEAGTASAAGNVVFAGITQAGGSTAGNGAWINRLVEPEWVTSNHNRTPSSVTNPDGGLHGTGGFGSQFRSASSVQGANGAAFLELI